MTAGIIVLLVVLVLALLSVAWWRGHRAGMEFGVLAAKNEIQGTQAAFEHARAQWEDWEKKAESFRSFNAGILNERDTWQRLYSEQSVAHGNAQAIMMGAIEYMGKKLTTAGIPFQVPSVLEEVRQDFVRNHVTPVLSQSAAVESESKKSSEKSPEVGH